MKEIPLAKGLVALVDDEDYERVMAHKWHASDHTSKDRPTKRYYALCTKGKKRNGKRVRIRMHRFILNYEGKKVIDHLDGNTLNNQKSNLRIATKKQNCRNLPCHRDPVFPPPMRRPA